MFIRATMLKLGLDAYDFCLTDVLRELALLLDSVSKYVEIKHVRVVVYI